MTKQEWVDLIKDRLAGGDAPQEIKGKYHPEIIAKHIGVAYKSIIYEAYKEAKRLGEESNLQNYVKAYTVSVAKDTTRDQYYSDLPVHFFRKKKKRIRA